MIKKEQLSSELKIGKISIKDGVIYIEEYDKDLNLIDEYSIEEVFADYIDREFIKFKLEYIKEV